MKNPESQLQQAVMRWWRHAHAGLYCPEELLFAIPNGGARHIATAVRMKKEGVRCGVPDLMLAAPSKGSYGLFIELKAGKTGRVSEAQERMINLLNAHGYRADVCRSFDQTINTITDYLS
jgi:hypothetical protein